ncbi:MAG: response regulator [Verrucomicrobia bacterium]|jgi:CheY-like chemotaxis protein|nr:response regulator [Verrucomicrobiota bacterium]
MAADQKGKNTNGRILLLDDEQEFLELYEDLLAHLPSRPEVRTTNTGSRALAILDSEPVRLFLCDLKMPKMDGLQVLSIVRRKFPKLRTVVLTALHDEQFRSRAYALGVDMYWQKPASQQETKMFLECMESLLGRDPDTGFRGMQSKSLVDIIQLECLSQSSSVLKITHNATVGKIWIEHGELVDAEVEDLRGETAFHRILAWKTGGFESLPPEPQRERTIERSCNALLLEVAQAIDESAASHTRLLHQSPFSRLEKEEGLEFAVLTRIEDPDPIASRGLEEPRRMAEWTREALNQFRTLGDRLNIGEVQFVDAQGTQRNIGLGQCAESELCLGWKLDLPAIEVRERTKRILTKWGS